MKLVLSVLSFFIVPYLSMAQSIYPTPQNAKISANTKVSLQNGIKLIDKDSDKDALSILEALLPINNKSKISLVIGEDGVNTPKNIILPEVSGAYYLKVSPKEIIIKGYDERGTFYAIQTLRQLINDNSIPECEILDFPQVKFRGAVEGFYGKPWSHRDRLAQFKFYGENKMNTYIYGPKDDPYHCSLVRDGKGGWRAPYPKEQAEQIKELALTARANKVDFVWAIHPGQDIKWNEEDAKNLINKFEHMYSLGVRSFAVFFDDISGEGTNPRKQAELLNKINREFVKVKGNVTPLVFCPTEYNKSWANPAPDGYLPILGENLDKDIEIMWTGDKVCADITMGTLNWVNERIKRPTYIWWNYPVTDYAKHVMLQGPAKGLANEATNKDMSGFVSNPMENSEASKIALFGVADYTWNPANYNPLITWEAAIKAVMPNISDAYRAFAIHTSQIDFNAHGYYMNESWESDSTTIKDDFRKLGTAANLIEQECENGYLLAELKPWLKQAKLLGKRGADVFELIDISSSGNNKQIWNAYLDGIMTEEQKGEYNAHKVGLQVLNPFVENTRKEIGDKLYENISGKQLAKITPITSFPRVETLPAIADGSSLSYFNSFEPQKADSWIGLDLGEVKDIKSVYIEQGRNEGDSYYMKSGILEGSVDGNNWVKLMEVPDKSYTIKCSNIPSPIRYIRLKAASDNNTKSRLAIRRFEVGMMANVPSMYSNITRLQSAQLVSKDNIVSISPILEVVKAAPKEYFGIEFPAEITIESANIDLNNPVEVEYSLDGNIWTKKSAKVRFVRYINNTQKPIEINIKKFEIISAKGSNNLYLKAFDGNLSTSLCIYGAQKFPIQKSGKVVILTSKQSRGIINAILQDGSIKELGIIDSAYSEFEIPAQTTALEFVGEIELFEVI